MKVITINNGLYQKIFVQEIMGHFGPKDGAYPHNSESNLRFFKKNLQNERADRYIWGNLIFLAFRPFLTV